MEGTQTYRLFDHVTITIQLKGSDAHQNKLAFYLLSKRPPKAKLAQGEMNFLKEIRKEIDADRRMDDDVVLDAAAEAEEEDSEKGDKKPKKKRMKRSMYDFFQDMREMGQSELPK